MAMSLNKNPGEEKKGRQRKRERARNDAAKVGERIFG